MTELIACLSAGKGTWTHVKSLMQKEDWEKVFLVTNQFGRENFRAEKEAIFITLDFNKDINSLVSDIKNSLKGKISGLEVALSIVSGEGKEHMALLAALMQLGIGFRLVYAAEKGIEEI